MLLAFKEVIASYSMPTDRLVRLNTDLDRMLKPHIQYLIDCRPHSVCMGNAIKFVRSLISHVRPDTPESQAKEDLMQVWAVRARHSRNGRPQRLVMMVIQGGEKVGNPRWWW